MSGGAPHDVDDRTRRLAWRVHDAKVQARSAVELADCTPEVIAADAIHAQHKWTWAALGFLRWLLEEWPAPGGRRSSPT